MAATGKSRGKADQTDQRAQAVWLGSAPTSSPTSLALFHLRAPSTEHRTHRSAMLAPYPDRLRSSRSTPAQTNPNANSTSTPTSTPPPPPSHVLSTTSTSQHRLFSSRSTLPLTRMRANSLSSPSPSSHVDSPSTSTDHVPPRPIRHSSRRPGLHRRPSTSSGVLDQKHHSLVPVVAASPSAAPFPVIPLSNHQSSSLVHHVASLAIFRLHTHS